MTVAGTDPEMDTTNTENHMETKTKPEASKSYRIAKIHHIVEKWQHSQNQCPTKRESRAQNTQMTAVA